MFPTVPTYKQIQSMSAEGSPHGVIDYDQSNGVAVWLFVAASQHFDWKIDEWNKVTGTYAVVFSSLENEI